MLDAGGTPEGVMAAVFATGAVLLLPLLAIVPLGELTSPGGLALALYLGAIPTALAYILFARGLERIGAGETATLTLAEPLTAAALGVIALGERPGAAAAAGRRARARWSRPAGAAAARRHGAGPARRRARLTPLSGRKSLVGWRSWPRRRTESETVETEAAAKPKRLSKRKAVEEHVRSYVDAIGRRDVEALGAHWSEDGVEDLDPDRHPARARGGQGLLPRRVRRDAERRDDLPARGRRARPRRRSSGA